MRRGMLLAAVAVPAALVPAGVAVAADAGVQAVDGTAANGYVNSWSPPNVSIVAGDTVTWSFQGNQVAHNVASDSPNWSLQSPVGVGQASVSHTFDTPGTYRFLCQVHPDMKGAVLVAAPGEEPPPPPTDGDDGPEAWPNPTGAPTVLEIIDERRPRLTRVRAKRVRNGARVRYRVSEPARVTVRVKRGRRTVEVRRRTVRRGTHRLTIRHLRAGRYRVQVRARDLAGNRSRLKRDWVRVR